MASVDEVKKLAALARLSVRDEEVKAFAKEFDSILAYVGQLESLQVHSEEKKTPPLRNVFREDSEPHEKGKYTKKIVEQFPNRERNYLKVKKIISYE
ncbi:Asp-tRNA(Asn)/Glu-tRNA(Gln) amidotransferase subunit GatC [Candidatus Parcubacteria bacterium]|nr:Asp-tRNA(Asn)/Glu-tRNA(Gln) amidotransferase subunit GatC [Candidatus Parcubacteria bacterium]